MKILNLESEGTNLIVCFTLRPYIYTSTQNYISIIIYTNKHHTHTHTHTQKCNMCCWSKCELVIQLSFSLQNHFLQFDEIITKTYSKLNISWALSLQISKSPLLNPIHSFKDFPPTWRVINPQIWLASYPTQIGHTLCYFHSKFLDFIEKHVIVIN